MDEFIADEQGHIEAPGHLALYPPGTRVFFVNGNYAGHESPVPKEEQAPAQPQKQQPKSGDSIKEV